MISKEYYFYNGYIQIELINDFLITLVWVAIPGVFIILCTYVGRTDHAYTLATLQFLPCCLMECDNMPSWSDHMTVRKSASLFVKMSNDR